MTSRRATIRIPDFHMAEESKDGQKKQYVVYHVLVSNGKWENKVYRRYTNFEEFHRAWGALYPALADKHQLPNNTNLVIDNPKYLLMNAAEKAEARRKKLEEYLRDTMAIDAILDFFVPFLECEKTDLKTKVTAVDEDLKPKAVNPHAKDDDGDAKTTASGLKIVSAIPQNEHLKVAKGNDGHATRKANKHKARFEAKYKDVIADPTAAISLNLTRADAPTGADATSPPLSPTGDGPAPPRPPPKPHKYGTAPAIATGAQALAAAKATAAASAMGGSAAVGASAGMLVTAVALFDFTPPSDKADCIALKKDEPLTIVEQSSDEWWFGKRGDGKDGFFPANYVKIVKTSAIPKAPPPRPTAAPAFGGASAAAGAGARPAGSTLSVAQVKAVKRHSTPMNLTSSADKPVSLLSPAALAAARGVRSDDDDDDDDDAPRKPKPPPRPTTIAGAAVATGAAGAPAIQKPARAATFQVSAGASDSGSNALSSAVKPRPPPPRPSGAVSPAPPPTAPAAPPAPAATAMPPPRPPSGPAQPPPMSAALKSSIAATPALRPTPKPASKPFGGIVASAAVAVNAGANAGAGAAAGFTRPPSASVAIGRGPSPSVASGPPKRPPPAPVSTKFAGAGAAAADGAGAASPQPASAGNRKFCTHCGKPVAAAAPNKPQTFCTHCGGKL